MRAIRIVAIVALLALAAVAALLAADVRAWPTGFAAGDAVYDVSPLEAQWAPSTRLPAGLSRSLLGVQDDVAARKALQLYQANVGVRPRLDNAVQVAAARASAETALAGVARSRGAARASQLEALVGVLAFGDSSQGGQSSQADQAVSAFQSAAKLDPSNIAAKYDLELLLRLLIAHGVRVGSQAGTGFGPGRHGAAGGVGGHGY
jgi:hypothetical protein